tara:strand:+ start:233 stop:958 length:726 start_codon:yes stop_codon:yes gene_type:complete
MTERRKQAWILLGIATPLLCYGAFSFELDGGGSKFDAMSTAVSLTAGIFGVISGLLMFFTKNSLGLIGMKTDPDFVYWDDYSDKNAKPDSRRIRSPEDLINLTIDDEFNKLRAKATSVDSKEPIAQKEEPKPIIKEEKDMSESNNETREVAHELTEELGVEVYRAKAEVDPVVSEDNESKSESLQLMQKEKAIVLKILKTREELESLLKTRDSLESDWEAVKSIIKQKGWVLAEDGTWKID